MQARLIGYAAVHDAKALTIWGRRILEVIAPEIGEAHEARVLEREEAGGGGGRVSSGWSRTATASWHGRFTLPTLQGAMLKKALMAYAAPRDRASVDGRAPVPGRPSNQRMGEAFREYIGRYPIDRLPHAGGMSATVVVTMDQETLSVGSRPPSSTPDTGSPRAWPGARL